MPLQGEYEPSPFEYAADQVAQYEATGGKEGGTLEGKPVIILTTKGRKSEKLRKNPLMRVEHEGTYAVVASKGGAPTHPVWYLNLREHPHVMLQDGEHVHDLLAREAHDGEKERWWLRATEVWPDYDTYQARTDREIPLILLEPSS
jgi:deazaflavin-dependent oxidoreductase (nitroreductase family)